MKKICAFLVFLYFFATCITYAQTWHGHGNGIPLPSSFGGSTMTVLGDGTNIYAAEISDQADSGIYYTNNGTFPFTRAVSPPITYGRSASLIQYADKIFLGLPSGVNYSDDNGHTWHSLPAQPCINPRISCFFATRDTLYVGVYGSGIYRTTDSANSWVHLGNVGLDTQVYHILTLNGRIFSAGQKKLQYTTDDGAIWNMVPPAPGMTSDWWPTGILSRDTTLYVASGAGLFKSYDYGMTWAMLNGMGTGAMIFVDSFLIINNSWPWSHRVQISNNYGHSFVPLDSGLSLNLGSEVLNFSFNDDYVILGVWSGCSRVDSSIYVIGRSDLHGAFRTAAVSNVEQRINTYGIYPNPAAGKVTIAKSDGKSAELSVYILDISGRTVYSGDFHAANNIEIPIDGIEHGIYFIKIKDTEGLETHKLIISN